MLHALLDAVIVARRLASDSSTCRSMSVFLKAFTLPETQNRLIPFGNQPAMGSQIVE